MDRRTDRWTDELTQQVEGHPVRRQERAKAATPGCLLHLWSIKEEPPHPPRTPGRVGVQQGTTPLPGSASGCSRRLVGSTWSSPGGDAPKIHRDLSAAARRHWLGSSGACRRIRKGPARTRDSGAGGEQKGRALTCSWRWAARGTQAASSRGTAPRRPGPAGPAGPAPSGRARGVGAGSPATSCALHGCRLRGSGTGSGLGRLAAPPALGPHASALAAPVPQ